MSEVTRSGPPQRNVGGVLDWEGGSDNRGRVEGGLSTIEERRRDMRDKMRGGSDEVRGEGGEREREAGCCAVVGRREVGQVRGWWWVSGPPQSKDGQKNKFVKVSVQYMRFPGGPPPEY